MKDWKNWTAPVLPETIPQGDMPGDKIAIGPDHIAKAGTIFPLLIEQLEEIFKKSENGRAVVTVCGGSGVGKSEIASLLAYYLNQEGIGSYTLSGDNYPRRIPRYNDAERLHVFRESALQGLVQVGGYTVERFDQIQQWQEAGDDANPSHVQEHSWFADYLKAGRNGLAGYLGTHHEIRFSEIEGIVKAFKEGANKIWLKRMGRTDTELWYEEVDFSEKKVLIIEWTHGNSDHYQGVDIPILLNSTPQETLAHRRARNRDGATDSPFTTMVLEIEQGMLERQAPKAKIILAKSGDLLSFEEYLKIMEESHEQ